ncbi:MAG: thiamine phosphate synthase [Clostridiales bacterium]|nr:thiamine phosphate synthase [Clostridiales bacterium]
MYRIIDANINRVSEGLRVVEDYMRFKKNNKLVATELREMRHQVRKLFQDRLLIHMRDSIRDVGNEISYNSRLDFKTSESELLTANIKRAQEGLRVIEEHLKIMGFYDISKSYEKLRYHSYDLEKKIVKKMYPSDEHIYLILGEEFSNGRSNFEVAKQALESGVRIIQYREKSKSKREKLEECKAIQILVNRYDGFFIINDDIDIAQIIQADGIHLGQDDMSIKDARKIVGDMCIGVSTHTIGEARLAVLESADYIGVGPIFLTQTKKNVVASKGVEFLKEVSDEIKIPYVAIGGIKINRLESIKPYINQIAMISEICSAEDIKGIIEQIRGELNHELYNTNGCC